MTDLDNPGPEDIAEVREALRIAGREHAGMTDFQAVEAMRTLLGEMILAPPVRSGTPAVNAYRWLTEALTAGGFAAPEDHDQQADLGDGADSVSLTVLGVLVLRHTSGGKPVGWSDEELAAQIKQPVADLLRAQKLLDQVAIDVDRPATPRPT